MPQSLTRNLIHLVFSTKKREALLADSVRRPLCVFAVGVLRDLDCQVLAINAWRDHLHVLFVLSKNEPLSQVVMELKRATSLWIKTREPSLAKFYWQAGYGAFSIEQSGVEPVKRYIARQSEHHRTATFQDEFRALLRDHRIEFDERYVWD